MEGAAPPRKGGVKSRRSSSFSVFLGGYTSISQGPRSRLGESEEEEGEESEETKVEAALSGTSEASKAQNLAHSDRSLVSQAEPNFLKMMEQMTQLMGQLTQAVDPRENSKTSKFKTPSIKAPEPFYGTQAHKLKGFIQSCPLIFHNDPANLFSDRKKVLYSTSFLTGRAGKWIEPYLSNISNEDPSYLLNDWKFFKTQLCTLFGDPNEVRKDEKRLGRKGIYSFLQKRIGIMIIGSDSSHINSSTSNDLATAFNIVSLAGVLKTPSLPSSVHIPSIMRSQSLLISRDEVFKEIKDFGEDVDIYLLHLFKGDMDPPPLSFTSCLEEQWYEAEEQEEIETVLKVVPPAYQ
ncbi:hypothetical protein O181_029162 [Austropuccinia psidii MF-1]|uniref:DUF4939 domain-containing protein n=1 Tax=Austropuccinia psidii MF-1 TaxID=1389203 RepID=A0A9Q3H398_9BASI|nr:hypothetical protein [Austropuccinia psidii MF-1]